MKVLLAGLGGDRVEINLARELARSGVGLFVIATPDSPAVSMCEAEGIPFVAHAFRHRFDRTAVGLYRRLLDEHPFDVVHCLTNRALSTALRAVRWRSAPPKLVAYRGTMGHLSWFDPASHLSYLNRRVDCIICVSDAVRGYLHGFRIPNHRLEVIWKGHDPSWYHRSPREALREFGIPEQAVVVCFTGNVRPVKGVDYLLKAFDRISPSEHVHLLVIGEVRDKSILRPGGQRPHVCFAGYRRDAAALAGACDISVMPSIDREGLPKATLESMAQGIPVVVTSVGGLPELVVDGECGLVVPPRDAEALAAAIRKLAADPAMRSRMGRAALERVAGPFHISETVRKTLTLYHRLMRVDML